jgi:hypothetical protein
MRLTTKTIAAINTGALLLGLAWGTAVAQNAAVYKWVDKQGVTHYTDNPPESAPDVSDTGIRYRRTNPQSVQARASRKQTSFAEQQGRRDDLQQAGAQDKNQREADENERRKNCEQSREVMEKYDTAHRLYRTTPDGEREYLDSDQIDSARAEAAAAVKKWCD